MQNRIIVLYFCLYLAMIGYGLSLPILPFYLQELALEGGISPEKISLHVGALIAIFAFMQMIFAPIWGRLSDYTGQRKPFLMLGLSGYAVSLALTGFSENLGTLYGARMLSGIFTAAILPLASAYIVDVSSVKQRVKRLAWHGTAVGLGVVSGPALGSFLIELGGKHPFQLSSINFNDFSTPFSAAALLVVLAMIVAGIWLPEPLEKKISPLRVEPGLFSASIIKSLSKGPIATCLLLSLVGQMGLSLFEGTFVLHAQTVMKFNPTKLGTVFIVCGLVMAIAQGTIVARFIEKYGAERILPAGFLLISIGLSLLMVTESMRMILIFVGILAFGMAIITPSIAVIITKYSKEDLARTLGLLTGANSLGQTIGPLMGSILFVFNIHLPYLLMAVLLLSVTIYLVTTDSLKA